MFSWCAFTVRISRIYQAERQQKMRIYAIIAAAIIRISRERRMQSMLQLKSLVAEVPPELGLGYGLGGGDVVLALFVLSAVGIMIGGPVSGVLASRIGPARTLLAGIAVGLVATFGMLVGVSVLPVAVSVSSTPETVPSPSTSVTCLPSAQRIFSLSWARFCMILEARSSPRRTRT